MNYYVDWVGRMWRGPERNTGKRYAVFCGFKRAGNRYTQVWKPKLEIMGEDWEQMTPGHAGRMVALYLEDARGRENT